MTASLVALKALYDNCGITFATYQSIEKGGSTSVVCRLCAKGNGTPHAENCGVGVFESGLEAFIDAEVTRLRSALQPDEKLIAEMQHANAAVNKAEGAVDYQVAMIALALVTRQFLRLLPAPPTARPEGEQG